MTKYLALVVVVLATVGASETCCDARHNGYAQQAAATQTCLDRGGVPIAEPIQDDNGHVFQVLKQCAFPCKEQQAER